MSLMFNGRCRDLKDWTVDVHGVPMRISVEPQKDIHEILLSAVCDGTVAIRLILQDSGVCEFHPDIQGTEQLCATVVESYEAAHWDNGFYQYAGTNKLSKCTYNDMHRMSIVAKQNYLEMDANFPSTVIRGGVSTDFSDRVNACQMLMCIAKLIARYTFEPWECSVLDAVCPKLEVSIPVLTKTQEAYLKEEYPVAFEAYVNNDGVQNVLEMLREAITRCPEGQ